MSEEVDRWRDYDAEDMGQEIARLVTDMARSRDAELEELRRRCRHLERELETQREVAMRRRKGQTEERD